ncbi:MAG: glycosyltransferase family 2 protein [Lentisphaeria bacterium]|nr:glycosyltransferase family 2 protein [Lentisphaeria bacterium]
MSVSDPKVSIVIPVYNAGPALDCALDSALGQSLPEVEVIAVDDGSTDGSAERLAARAASDSRLRVFRQPGNSGTLCARNRGLRECRGRYVMFLDPDDSLEKNAAAELSALAERENADVIHFGLREFARQADGTMKPRYTWTAPEEKTVSADDAVLRDLLRGGHNWSLCFKMIRAEVCRKALAETEDFFCIMGEDLYFYLAAAYHAGSLIQTGKAYYRYDTTAGITAAGKVTPEKFKRTATLLDALAHGDAFLRSKQVTADPELAKAWEAVQRGQYLRLWNLWHSRLEPGTRGEAGEYLLRKAPNKELFLLSVFDENDYLRENDEFLKFARTIYGVMNRIFPKDSYLRLKLKSLYKKLQRGKERK